MKRLLVFLLLATVLHASDIEVYPVAASGSMKPWFDENYFLLVKVQKFSELRVGQVIIYRQSKPYYFQGVRYDTTVHRIWSRSSTGKIVLCWGVNNAEPDPDFITEDMYVGTVVQWVTKEEYFSPNFRIPQ